jgi:glycerol-3-phosphate acyltransferase PlsY
VIGYFLGCLPFAYLAVRFIKNTDIRNLGSGNVGATNALRVLGPLPAVLVLFFDGLKGWLAVFLAAMFRTAFSAELFNWVLVAAGVSAILGHLFPVWLGFKGGKGVATGAGVLLALSKEIFFMAVVVAVVVIILTRYVSLGSIIGVATVFLLMVYFRKPLPFLILALFAGLFIIGKHYGNIQRLLNGTEKKIGQEKS